MRRRYSFAAPRAAASALAPEAPAPALSGLKLFGLTYTAGFLFVSLLIA